MVWIILKQLGAGSFRPEEETLGVSGEQQMEEAKDAGNWAARSRMPLINEINSFVQCSIPFSTQGKIVNGALSILSL